MVAYAVSTKFTSADCSFDFDFTKGQTASFSAALLIFFAMERCAEDCVDFLSSFRDD